MCIRRDEKIAIKEAVKHLITRVHPKGLYEIGSTDAELIQIVENSDYKV
jgi:hypothetical protein